MQKILGIAAALLLAFSAPPVGHLRLVAARRSPTGHIGGRVPLPS